MSKLFYIGVLLLLVFEFFNVYFIMPMPGSQESDTLELAYFLYSWRWIIRCVLALMIIAGGKAVLSKKRKWIPIILVLLIGYGVYFINFNMQADHIFLQVENLIFKGMDDNSIPNDRLVIGVEHNGEAKAYPISFIGYHHQVQDTIGGKAVIVTYCTVCRTGRVYEPLVKGEPENFRLVGMDHYNAMFEDERTGSWWRQSTGEAVSGDLKGEFLPNVPSVQMTVKEWFRAYPDGLMMQEDPSFSSTYDSIAKYEKGESTGSLTGTDKDSWNSKSWVLGIELNGKSKAYDWNELKEVRAINDKIGETEIVIVLASDDQSFAAFERPKGSSFKIDDQDQLISKEAKYDFMGKSLEGGSQLNRIQVHQEFWHSWQTFHPMTEQY